MASILRSEQSGRSREGRSRRQSRVSREIVSSNQGLEPPIQPIPPAIFLINFILLPDVAPLPAPTVEWQDRLATRLGAGSGSSSHVHSPQRRRLNGAHPDWDAMYTMEGSDGNSGKEGSSVLCPKYLCFTHGLYSRT
jgi:hypothetical protein